MKRIFLCLIFLYGLTLTSLTYSQENEGLKWDEPVADFLDQLEWGKLKLSGSVSWRYHLKDYGETDTRNGDLDFNRIWLGVSWNDDAWSAGARYHFYRYEDYATWVNFMRFAWINYKFNDHHSIRGGITKVPFGINPYASLSWFETPAYYLGFEDDFDLGFVYTWNNAPFKVDLAYFPRDEGVWLSNGRSKHSSRYSSDIVPEGDSGNKERHQFNLRLIYTLDQGKDISNELGISWQYGLIPNEDTNKNGDHQALALHWHGKFKPWEVKLSYINYRYKLENPAGQDRSVVQFGYFDTFPYNVASRGQIYIGSIGYTFNVNKGPINTITPYIEYTYLDKHKSSWTDSQQFNTGLIWDLGNLFIYSEIYFAREHPDMGEGTFPDGLASGSGNADWHTWVLVTFAYFF
ncbi:MAG: hypothetical protein HRT88_17705 [Lentisphaeraceae bacterium]|nr:hypothetical protein [Lentisphaeraceae bacterium]